MIEIQGLSIFYGKRKLAYPDISVKKGEAVGIAGKSGCGKTSLFSFLLSDTIFNAFNIMAIITLFRTIGYSPEVIAEHIKHST